MAEKESKKSMKKTLIIVLSVLIGILLLLYLLTLLIPYIYNATESEETELIAEYSFYEPDFNENIFNDNDYISLTSNGILMYDNASNSIDVITPDNAIFHGDTVVLMTDMVYAIINGDNEKYNSCFSQQYFKKHTPKEDFTMQKIYDAKLKPFKIETIEDGTQSYVRYVYTLTYYIYENNGTFRKDIGDGSRTQYISITNREGKYLIDSIAYERTK